MATTTKQTAANNDFLREVKARMNAKIYKTTAATLNAQGEDAARQYLRQFFTRPVNEVFERQDVPAEPVETIPLDRARFLAWQDGDATRVAELDAEIHREKIKEELAGICADAIEDFSLALLDHSEDVARQTAMQNAETNISHFVKLLDNA